MNQREPANAPTPEAKAPADSILRKDEEVYKLNVKVKDETIFISTPTGVEKLSLKEWLDPDKVEALAKKMNVEKAQLLIAISNALDELEVPGKKIKKVVFKPYRGFLYQEVYVDGVEKFIRWDGEEAVYVDEFGEKPVFKPMEVLTDETDLPVVIMASKREDYGTVQNLLTQVEEFLKKYVETNPETYWLLSRFVLHTWVYDVGEYTMQLLVTGDKGTGKTRLLKVLSLICYNSVLATGGTSLSAYRRIRGKYRGTLLLNEFELSNHEDSNMIIQFFNAGFEKGNRVILSDKQNPRRQDIFNPFGPKVLASRSIIENVPALSRTVIIKMKPCGQDIPIDLPPEAFEEAESLRNKLLAFRLDHWRENFKLPRDVDRRLRKNQILDTRTKQICQPMLILASITGLSIDETFSFYEEAVRKMKRIIANETPEGILFNELLSIVKEDQYDKDEFSGLLDEKGQLIGVSSKILASRTGFSPSMVSRVLKKIGLVSEKIKRRVQVYRKDVRDVENETKSIRRWVFPNNEDFLRALQNYGLDTEPLECPNALRSLEFLPVHIDATSDASATQTRVETSQVAQETEVAPLGTDKNVEGDMEKEKHQVPGPEESFLGDSVIDQNRGSTPGRKALENSVMDLNQASTPGKEGLESSLNQASKPEKEEDASPGEAPVNRLDADIEYAFSSSSAVNEAKVAVSGSISPEAVLRELSDCHPSAPIYMTTTCYACGESYSGLWRQLEKGDNIYQLCESCFEEWSKHFLNGGSPGKE